MSKSLMYGLTRTQLHLFVLLASLITAKASETHLVQVSKNVPELEFSKELSKVLSLKWSIQNGDLWLRVTKSAPGWTGISFAKDMKKGDVLLIQKLPDDTSKLNVQNCFFQGYDAPNCTMSMQYTVVEQTSDDNSFSVLVRRPLTATDRLHGADINPEKTSLVWAYTKNNQVEYHGDPESEGLFGSVILDLSKGINTQLKVGYKFGFLRHEYAQAIIWTLPVDLLILLARYFKGVPAWADIHLSA